MDRLEQALERLRQDEEGAVYRLWKETLKIVEESIDSGLNIDQFIIESTEFLERRAFFYIKGIFTPIYILFLKRDFDRDILFRAWRSEANYGNALRCFTSKICYDITRETETFDFLVKGIDDFISRGAKLYPNFFLDLFPIKSPEPKHEHRKIKDIEKYLECYRNLQLLPLPLEDDILNLFNRYEKWFLNGELSNWSLITHGYRRIIDFLQKHHCNFVPYCYHSDRDIFEFIHPKNITGEFYHYLLRIKRFNSDDNLFLLDKRYIIPEEDVYQVIGNFLNAGANPYEYNNGSATIYIRTIMNSKLKNWYQTLLDDRVKPVEY